MNKDTSSPQVTWSEPCGCSQKAKVFGASWEASAFPRITAVGVDVDDDHKDRIDDIRLCRDDDTGVFLNSPGWFASSSAHIFVLHPGERIEEVVVNDCHTYIGGIQIVTNRRTSQWFGAQPRDATERRLTPPSGHFVADIVLRSVDDDASSSDSDSDSDEDDDDGGEDEDEDYHHVAKASLRVAFAPIEWLVVTDQVDVSSPIKTVVYAPYPPSNPVETFYRLRPTINALVISCKVRVTNVQVLSPDEYARMIANGGFACGLGIGEHILTLEKDESILRVFVDCDQGCVQALRFETTHGLTQWFGTPKLASARREFDIRDVGHHANVCGFFGASQNGIITRFGVLSRPTRP